jgi:hypothetical protein
MKTTTRYQLRLSLLDVVAIAADGFDFPVVIRETGVDVINEETGRVLMAGIEQELERGDLIVFETVAADPDPNPEKEV